MGTIIKLYAKRKQMFDERKHLFNFTLLILEIKTYFRKL